jgi:hypothetical protein
MLANKRLVKVGGYLRVLPEQLAGGEREWHASSRWRRQWRRCGSGWRRGGAFIAGVGRPWVTRDDGGDARRATVARGSRVRRRRRRRTAGLWRARVLRRGLGAPRGGEACWDASSSGSVRFGPGAASGGVGAEAGDGGARPATGGARGARRRGARRSGPKHFTGADFEMEKL